MKQIPPCIAQKSDVDSCRLLGQTRKGMLIIVSGPSGTGKGTLCERLLAWDPNIVFSISATTRAPRDNEKEGVHYSFITEEEFDQLLQTGNLLEHATVHDHRYGTPRPPVEAALEKGLDVLLDVDSQGAMSVMKQMPHCVSIFILPPSFDALRQRLRTRNTDDADEIAKRLRNARDEIARYIHYDYTLINDDLESAFKRLLCIIAAERMRTLRYHPDIPEQ
ncbi:MAG: guanylate kinase [Christensenellales bacterium]|jgi:guanylate kinase